MRITSKIPHILSPKTAETEASRRTSGVVGANHDWSPKRELGEKEWL
jgi:hypothetical protein